MQSWWRLRDEPNVLLMHYHGMPRDLTGSIAEIADFLEIDVTTERLADVTHATTFDKVKKNRTTYVPVGGTPWSGGADTFFNQGTNGRWQHEISAQNLARYDRAAAHALSSECRAWVEGGRTAL
jgi:aryl sulfotransferase